MPPPPVPRRAIANSPPQDTDELEYVDVTPPKGPKPIGTIPSPVWDIELDLNE